MALDRKLDVMCAWCSKISKLGQWNDLNYNKCNNREMKRAFTPLTERRAFLRKSDTFYICPICGKWSRGCQLSIVNTNDKSLTSLGRESVINFGGKNKLEEENITNNNKANPLLREESIEEKIKKATQDLTGSVRLTNSSILDLDSLI